MGQKVNSRQLPFFYRGPHTKPVFHLQPGLRVPIVFELIMSRGLVVIGGEGRGWLDSFVSCQPGEQPCVCNLSVSWGRLDTLQRHSASSARVPRRSLPHAFTFSLSLAALLSALLHSTPRGPALCLPCQLNGVCQVCQYDWFLWFCLFSCFRRKKTWHFNLSREKRLWFFLLWIF